MPAPQGLSLSAALVPVFIDKLAPEGQVPDRTQLARSSSSLFKSLLG